MEEKLLAFIQSLKVNDRIQSFNEATTKQDLIQRPLSLLGWNVFNSDEVSPEYLVEGDRVDYSLRINNSNMVFLEVKRVKEELEDHQEQLLGYSFKQGVKLAILTNGVTWWFYLPLHEGNWEQRKFYSIDIFQQGAEDIAAKFVDFLSRENIANGQAFETAQTVYKGRQRQKILQAAVPKAWNRIISEPDEFLVELINETAEKICGYRADEDMIVRFLHRYREQLSFSDDVPVSLPTAGSKQQQTPKTRGSRPASKETRKDSLLRLFYDIGGAGTRSQINERVPDYWELRPKEREIEKGTRKPKYWHHVASTCQALKDKDGYLENPKRGTWRITEKGRNYLESMSQISRKRVPSPRVQQASSSTLTSISDDYTGKEISSFHFRGTRHEVHFWYEFLVELCSIMNTAHGNDFDRVLNTHELRGSKRMYFARDRSQLKQPKEISNTGIFVEANLSAVLMTRVASRLIALFGYSDDDLKIELKVE